MRRRQVGACIVALIFCAAGDVWGMFGGRGVFIDNLIENAANQIIKNRVWTQELQKLSLVTPEDLEKWLTQEKTVGPDLSKEQLLKTRILDSEIKRVIKHAKDEPRTVEEMEAEINASINKEIPVLRMLPANQKFGGIVSPIFDKRGIEQIQKNLIKFNEASKEKELDAGKDLANEMVVTIKKIDKNIKGLPEEKQKLAQLALQQLFQLDEVVNRWTFIKHIIVGTLTSPLGITGMTEKLKANLPQLVKILDEFPIDYPDEAIKQWKEELPKLPLPTAEELTGALTEYTDTKNEKTAKDELAKFIFDHAEKLRKAALALKGKAYQQFLLRLELLELAGQLVRMDREALLRTLIIGGARAALGDKENEPVKMTEETIKEILDKEQLNALDALPFRANQQIEQKEVMLSVLNNQEQMLDQGIEQQKQRNVIEKAEEKKIEDEIKKGVDKVKENKDKLSELEDKIELYQKKISSFHEELGLDAKQVEEKKRLEEEKKKDEELRKILAQRSENAWKIAEKKVDAFLNKKNEELNKQLNEQQEKEKKLEDIQKLVENTISQGDSTKSQELDEKIEEKNDNINKKNNENETNHLESALRGIKNVAVEVTRLSEVTRTKIPELNELNFNANEMKKELAQKMGESKEYERKRKELSKETRKILGKRKRGEEGGESGKRIKKELQAIGTQRAELRERIRQQEQERYYQQLQRYWARRRQQQYRARRAVKPLSDIEKLAIELAQLAGVKPAATSGGTTRSVRA
ncbi:MAG: hypothetical protein M1549_00255 [Candidatus Dependentiae bacterium]|nr:hypothetical protein [Candidatus Dependentiae bacterium]